MGIDIIHFIARRYEKIPRTRIGKNSPPYTFFLLNDDMELHRNRHFFI
jgi:hypothetical protein